MPRVRLPLLSGRDVPLARPEYANGARVVDVIHPSNATAPRPAAHHERDESESAMPTREHLLKTVGLHDFADAKDWADALNELAKLSDTEISDLAGLVLSRKEGATLSRDGCRPTQLLPRLAPAQLDGARRTESNLSTLESVASLSDDS
ncbi:MAG: hypothetical protein IPK66_02945 [Rhodospirillales bacterium]|nr:hypothetical protein [Rhodospirillales bacterium]